MYFATVSNYYKKPHKNDYENNNEYKTDLSLWQPLDIIYPYIESEIPVIIAIGNHVRAVIGHKMYDNIDHISMEGIKNEIKNQEERIKKDYQNQKYIHPAIVPSSIFTDALIINDYQEGIYKLMPYDKGVFKIIKGNYPNLVPINKPTIKEDVSAIIIPLPDKIYLLAEDAFSFARTIYNTLLLYVLLKQADKGYDYAKELLFSTLVNKDNPVIFRTYFIKSYEFKQRIRENNEINSKLEEYYLSMNMPRFIWVVEISNYEIFGRTKNILGEIIFDSTANKYDLNGSFLSIHLPGFFYKNAIVYEEDLKDENLPNEEPYFILSRNRA